MTCEVAFNCLSPCRAAGAEAYAKLYPETSSDGVLRLGNICPDFTVPPRPAPPVVVPFLQPLHCKTLQ